jgi:AbiEi antitoxin C-terminal domain
MRVARGLRLTPFRGSAAVKSAVVTWGELRGPRFRRLLPDVYVTADLPLDHRLWSQAALVYAGPDAAISGVSAAVLWGVPIGVKGQPTEITVPRSRRIRVTDAPISIVRTSLPGDHVASLSGMRVTSPERTAFDLVARVDRDCAVIAIESFVRRDLASHEGLAAFGVKQFGTRGGRLLSAAAALAEPLSESPMETRCRLVLIDGGLPAPRAQVKVFDANGRLVARLDMAYEEWKIGIEYEGDHHRDRRAFQDDLARLNALTSLDWVIVRVGPRDVYRNPDQLVHRIMELIARRATRST